jgi:hypothetical protein
VKPAILASESTDFSLVLGGPLYQLFQRAHLSGSALEHVRRRIVIISLFAWAPLLVLSALNGQLIGGTAEVPFLLDAEVHVRFLVAIPLLIVAELVVHRRLLSVLKQFMERKVIPDSARAGFGAAIASAFRLRNSVLGEILLIAFVYGVGVLIIWRHHIVLNTTTWYTIPTSTGYNLSLAGIWYGYVSLPIFQFLLLRWIYRLFIWTRFLWQVSRLDLSLIPTHPDHLGGLGFLAQTAHAFTPLAVALGALTSGFIADRIFHLGAKLTDFKMQLAALTVLVECLLFGPLLVFAGQLASAKRKGMREYGALAERYVREFDAKWLRGGAAKDERLVGSGDLQSLADLGNSFELVRGMRVWPVTKDGVLRLAIATLVPVAPLLLTMMSLEDLIKKLVGAVF